MSERLVTVSTHLEPVEAAIARNRLDAAGIRAEVLDDQTATVAWQLGAATGGAKLLVAEEDAERALLVLAGDGGGPEGPEAGFTAEPPGPDEDDGPLNGREEAAERSFRAALLGLAAWPLQAWATVLVMDAWASDEPLRPRVRSRLRWATGLNLTFLLAVVAFLAALLAPAAFDAQP